MARNNLMTRRGFLASTGAIGALLAMGNPTWALSGGQAEKLITSAVNEINTIIASRRSDAAMLRAFEKVFTRYADVNIIALTTLGPARRSASKRQLDAYVSAYRSYFARKYGKRFNEFVGGEIIVSGSRAASRYVEVATTAKLRGSAPFAVDFQVSDRSGSPKIINIIIEGVNTLSAERVEIGARLDRRGGNIDALIKDLKSAG